MHLLHPNGANSPFKVILSFFFLLFLSKVTCSPFITGTVSLEHQAHGDGDSEVILGPFLKYFSLFLSCLCSIEKAIVNTLYRPLKRIQTVQLLT